MREGTIFSGVFHLGLLVLVVVGLPSFRALPPEPPDLSNVEVVTIAPKATAPDLPKPPTPKPPPDVKPTPTPPPPAPATPPTATPTPTPKPPDPIPDKKAEVPKPLPKKEEPKKEPPKPQPDRFDSILKNLDKSRPTPTPDKPKPQQVQQPYVPPPPTQTASNLSAQLSRSEMDGIRDRIRPCWNFPAGAKDADQLLVLIEVQMNPDATVRDARIVDNGRMSDPYYRSAAESAQRAVLNPACWPLPLSPEKYNTWKTMTLRFDPRDL